VNPLLYPVTVCPSCYYGAYERDFLEIPEERKANVDRSTDARLTSFRNICPSLDFNGPRGLREGLASYYFAIMCYDFFPREFAPVFKQGVSALRAAWVASDLDQSESGQHWDYVGRLFYRKARFFYAEAVEREQSGSESIPTSHHLGPDLDKNYGFDGVLYISGLLEYKYGPRKDAAKRVLALNRAKRTVSRLFGMGKASKSKPSAILDMARDLYATISADIGTDPEEAANGDS
jgi:hypothetical protein